MSAYAGDPSASPKDAVRFHLGDTTAPYKVSDAEITYLLTLHPNPIRAAAAAARALSTKYGDQVSKTVGSLTIDYGQRSDRYAALADTLERQAQAMSYGLPYAGGISIAERDAAQAGNSDDVGTQEGFRIGMHDHPGDFGGAGVDPLTQ